MLPILLTLTAAFAILCWSDLRKGLWLLAAVLPSYLLRTEIFGVPTTLLELLVVTYLLIWSVRFLGSRRLQPATWRGLKPAATTLAILMLLIAAAVSVFVAPDLASALGVWKAYFLEPMLLFLIIRYELSTTKPVNTNVPDDTFVSSLFVALGVSGLVLSVIAIAQWLTGSGIPIPWDIERRVTGVFDYPNALGLFLGPIVVIGTVSLLSRFSGVRNGAKAPLNFFWTTIVLLSSLAIILAQSEAAIVSILATLGIAGLVNAKTRFATAVALFVAVLAICLSSWRGVVIDKLTLQDYSGQVRLSQWSETIDMLGDRWLLGAGLSGYPTAFAPYHRAEHIEIFQYPHNIVLNIWVELGLLGLFAFALLSYQVVVSLRERSHSSTDEAILRRADGLLRSLSFPPAVAKACPTRWSFGRALAGRRNDTLLIAFLALLQMTIHGLVDVPYFKNDLAILTWILLAIVFAYVPPARAADQPR